ncbi:MAG TPA: choice-of-anchor R domain-containing protein [Verrucomicrobiae bacterium]|nr:choice-of-anchor R domain-containing protein [Verrucomicrobiae bacterium]
MNANNTHKQIHCKAYMKKAIYFLVSMICLLLPVAGRAQSMLYVSNLLQTAVGSEPVGSDSWLAGYFETGTNAGGYILNSVQLLMNAGSGTPSGFTVSVYSSTNIGPGSRLGDLGGSDPLAGGLFTYTNSGIAMTPSTYYSVVVNAATPVAQGAYSWSAVFGSSNRSNDGWIIGAGYYSSADGSSWQFSRDKTFQMAIYATAIPEPDVLGLLGLGGLAFVWHRRKATRFF